jgi:hypothetical protein
MTLTILTISLAMIHPTQVCSAPDPSKQLLADLWYTVTVAGNLRYAYYHETITVKDGRYHYQSKMVKNEEGFLNEDSIGAFAEVGQSLKPLFFNFYSKYRNTETSIDGTVQPDGSLVIKPRRNGQALPTVHKTATKNSIFSSMFPLWVHLNYENLKKNKSMSFNAIVEDSLEEGFLPIPGRATIDPKDPKKINIEFRNTIYKWIVNEKGWMTQMEIPSQQLLIQSSTQSIAEKFLK